MNSDVAVIEGDGCKKKPGSRFLDVKGQSQGAATHSTVQRWNKKFLIFTDLLDLNKHIQGDVKRRETLWHTIGITNAKSMTVSLLF